MFFFIIKGRKDKWWARASCFDVKAGHHCHICSLYLCVCVCVCFCATGTLPAEALLRRVQKQGATTAFFVCLCYSIFLGYQYSACGIIALEV